MIPQFPEFKPLDVGDKPQLDALFARLNPQASDYTFTNLFGWRHAWHYRVARFGEGVLVLRESKGAPSFLQPLVPDGHTAAVRACLDYLCAHTATPVIERAGEDFTASPSFGASAFVLTEDRDNFD